MAGVASALVVDDDPVQLEFLRYHLSALGVESVETVADGSMAIRRLQPDCPCPDVIVLDLHMAGADGIEVIDHLQEIGCTSQLILLSGAAPMQLNAAARLSVGKGLNVAGSLRKPLDPGALAAILVQPR